MYTTAQSLAAKLIEQFRLLRAQNPEVTQVTGFACPTPKCCDFESIEPVAVDPGDNPVEGGDAEAEGDNNTVAPKGDFNQSRVESNFNIATPQTSRVRDNTGEAIIYTAPTKVAVSWDSSCFQIKISYFVYTVSDIQQDKRSISIDLGKAVQDNNIDSDDENLGYNFTLQLNKSQIRDVEKVIQRVYKAFLNNSIKQLHSAPSFVYKVEDKERKYSTSQKKVSDRRVLFLQYYAKHVQY